MVPQPMACAAKIPRRAAAVVSFLRSFPSLSRWALVILWVKIWGRKKAGAKKDGGEKDGCEKRPGQKKDRGEKKTDAKKDGAKKAFPDLKCESV